jgi:putative endonuclease
MPGNIAKGGWTYITTTRKNTVLYTGSTAFLKERVEEHKNRIFPESFTARYNVDKLVWFQFFESIEEAIQKEKQIKGWKRQKKVDMINRQNPSWRDLYEDLP